MNYNAKINVRAISVILVLFMTATLFSVLSFFDREDIYGSASTGVVTDGPLFVRSGPGTNYGSIGTLSKGKTVNISGTKSATNGVKWYKISYGSKTGYVSSQFVKINTAAPSTKTSTGTVNSGPLNVRSGPGTTYGKIGSLEKGKTVTITGTKTASNGAKWTMIKFGTKTGYVSSQYITVKTSAPAPKPVDKYSKYSPKKQGVTLAQMDVKEKPAASSKRIGGFKKNINLKLDGLHITAAGEKWYKVYTNGKYGYILASNVKLGGTVAPAPKPVDKYSNYSPKKLGATLVQMDVMEKPSASSKRITGFKKGITLKLDGLHTTASGEKWYRVTVSSGYGYILAKNVDLGGASGFTLSSDMTKPTTIKKGTSYVLRGKLYSNHKMTNVVVGVKSSSGSWITGKYISTNPNATSYDIAKADASIKFGTLAEGDYFYCVYAKDAKGYGNYVLKHPFKVTGLTPPSLVTGELGTSLSYKSSVITAIGKQPYSGPCGIYAMAYSRAILDGSFTKGGHSTIHNRIISEYGNGTNYAHWYKAGGSNTYYTSNKSCYQDAIKQVDQGRPSILLVHNGYTGNTHYVTIIGYTKGTTASNVELGKLIALDPAYGTIKYLGNMKYYNHPTAQLIKF